MEKFEKRKLNKKDHRTIDTLAAIIRILLTPIYLVVRIYFWVWDYFGYDS